MQDDAVMTPDECMALAQKEPTHIYTTAGGKSPLQCRVLPSLDNMETTETRILLYAAEDQCHYNIMVVQTANVCAIEEHETVAPREPVEDKPDDSSKKTDEATKVQWWHHSRICAARCECNSVVKYTDEMTVMTVRGL